MRNIKRFEERYEGERIVSVKDNVNDKNINIKEMVDLLNDLYDENQELKLKLDIHKHPLWSTRESERKVNELIDLLACETKKNALLLEEINLLRIENMRFKEDNTIG